MNQKDRVISQQALLQQQEYAAGVQQLYQQKLPRQPLACAVTFGCQQNEADTELIRGMLVDMGFGLTEDETQADLLIFNTCAIREHAEMRVFGNVGQTSHYKKANPDVIICVCGCMPQQPQVAEKIKNSYPYVDIVFGTHALYKFPELLYRRLTEKKRVFEISGDERGMIWEEMPTVRKAGPGAWLSIMYGCNNFCSYCIVPYVRGRERSRSASDILNEARRLISTGAKDITLLGQNVNSYRGEDGEDIAELMKRICALEGDFRLRFMTSHPKDASEKLFRVMAEEEKVVKHFHLPIQSGSDRILSAMNRKYNRKQYLEKIEMLREYVPDVSITSDIIVGFPGEDDDDFEGTLDILEKVRYDMIFSFIYSPREGTPAAKMVQVPHEISTARFERMLALQNSISDERNSRFVGRTMRILAEGESKTDTEMLTGRGDCVRPIHFKAPKSLIGEFVDVKITGAETFCLHGKV